MAQIKKGTETDKKKCPACKQPIILPSQTFIGAIVDKCPRCNKKLSVNSSGKKIEVVENKTKNKLHQEYKRKTGK